MSDFTLPVLPAALTWANPPVAWQIEGETLHISAGPVSDLFTDPAGGAAKDDSPRAVFTPDPQWTLSAHVTVDFNGTYDAGVLLLHVDAEHWAKLCFEYSPLGEPMVVSVVTNGVSDDCNSTPLARNDVYLRVTRLGAAFAFHYSEDGRLWRLVRYFALRRTADLRAGFSAQAPTGPGCHVTFDQIVYRPNAVKDVRSGE